MASDTDTPLRVFVVDDAVVYRKILSDTAGSLAGVALVGTAASGAIALQKLEHTAADLVLLDVHMPELSGIETLRLLRDRFPRLEVVMVSGVSDRQADTTMQALEMGALDFIHKPELASAEANRQALADSLKPILRLVATRRVTRRILQGDPAPRAAARRMAPPTAVPARRFELVAIGVSTGGPNALHTVLPRLPPALKAPVLIVQHMPPLFTASLAEHLAKRTALAVREARAGDAALPGTVLIAPGGRHMLCRRRPDGGGWTIGLDDGDPVNSCRPSADVLFHSLAESGPRGVLAVMMTGMGEDGVNGVRALKEGGGYCLAQDEASCVVYGMPRAVVERGLADEIVPLHALGERIGALVNTDAARKG